MIEDRVIQISEHGTSRMLFGNQWIAREAPKRGLRDPWAHRPNRPIRTEEVLTIIAGTEIPATKTIYNEPSYEEIKAWKIERDEYIRQRDEWIALQMFKKYGYDTFLEDCTMYHLSEEFINSVVPCESKGEPQCNLYCPKWDSCDRR
jgi:hypothetical protein